MAEKEKVKVIPVFIEGFEINAQNVTYQKLQEFSLRLYEKLLNHRKERNFLVMERDKYRTILENTRHEIKLTNAILINKEDEWEKAQQRYRHEMREVEQEVKFTLYDHNICLTELKLWEKSLVEKTQEKALEEELELLEEKKRLKELYLEEVNKNEEEFSNLKTLYQDEIIKLKNKLEGILMEKEIQFKKHLDSTIKHMKLKHEMEMSEVEERKNTHLAELKTIHKNRLNEMKSFFNTITAENLTVISNLKQNLESMKRSRTTVSAEIKQLKEQNNNMKEPLENSKLQVKNLSRQVINYEKDLISLKNNKHLLKQSMKEKSEIERRSSLIQRQIKDADMLSSNILDSNYLMFLKAFQLESLNNRNELKQLIKDKSNELTNKYADINKLSFDPDVSKALKDHKFEYWNPKQLSFELAVICKAHNDLLKTLGEKLNEFCIPETEIGEVSLGERFMFSTGSANLVSKQ